jgi:lipopolysaccharide transport system permease protein
MTVTGGELSAAGRGRPGERVTLVGQWIRRDLRVRYRRSALRLLWAVLQPCLTVATYAFVFGVIFSQSGGDLPYLSFLLAGMVAYRVVAAALSSTTSLVENADVIGQAHFPLEVVPIARVLGNGTDLLIMTVGLVVVATLQDVGLHLTIVALPIVLLSVVLFACAVCVAGSTVQVFVRDLEFVTSFVVMALFFASPISYQPDQLPQGLRWINVVNPVSVDVEAVRDVVLRGEWPAPLFWLHLVLAGALLAGAVAHMRAVQHRIVDLG